MLITSARRTINTDWVAEASFYEGEVYQKTLPSGRKAINCDVIVLTFSSGLKSYYSPIKNTAVCPDYSPDYNPIDCHCDPLFFADLLANFFS